MVSHIQRVKVTFERVMTSTFDEKFTLIKTVFKYKKVAKIRI